MNTVITLDLAELADEWQNALDELDDDAHGLPLTEDERDEHSETVERCEELCRALRLEPVEPSTLKYSDRLGVGMLIREDTFEEYAREFAEDVHGDLGPLNSYIDWESYANGIKQDYEDIEYDGHTWLRRA